MSHSSRRLLRSYNLTTTFFVSICSIPHKFLLMDLNSYVILKYSFFHRIIDMWNQLPFDIRYSDDVNNLSLELRNVLVTLTYFSFS